MSNKQRKLEKKNMYKDGTRSLPDMAIPNTGVPQGSVVSPN